jgi:signal transduction histidine kinase
MKTLNPQPDTNLLIVDDSPANLQLLSGMFKQCEFKVRLAPSGELALQAARREPPDIILLDINMPGMNGYEVCERLKADESLKAIPVIFISALDGMIDKVKGFGVGAVDYISKPFQFEEVEARVRTHLALRRQERQLQENLARLKELERLRDSLVHMIVHDMRSPLSSILVCMEMLSADPPHEPAHIAKFIKLASKSASNLKGMITQLLDISRLEAGKMPIKKETHNLTDALQTTLESMTAMAGERRLRLEAPAPIIALYDQDIVGRVVGNLLANAFKFTPPDGSITLAVAEQAGFVRVAVADDGRGIAREHHHKIFEKFGQADGPQSSLGTGLGLTFCKLAVEAHGGNIGVESEPGRGSTFWFTLPGKAG